MMTFKNFNSGKLHILHLNWFKESILNAVNPIIASYKKNRHLRVCDREKSNKYSSMYLVLGGFIN